MPATDIHRALAGIFSELVDGAPPGGGAFVLNSGDAGLLRSLDRLTPDDASHAIDGGATIAAHATHLSYGLALMSRWASEGGNPFADAHWDDAWNVSRVDAVAWDEIRAQLRRETERWHGSLVAPREVTLVELHGMVASVAHIAYHLGAIRQISRTARGPREGTFG